MKNFRRFSAGNQLDIIIVIAYINILDLFVRDNAFSFEHFLSSQK